MNYPVIVLLSLLLLWNSSFAAEVNRSICINSFKAADYQRALVQCTAVAQKGDMDAAFIVARLYAQGSLGKPDLIRSVKWLKHAAQLGHAEAAYNLGIAYQYGRGGEQSLTKAIKAYQQAADANNPKALRNLAILYEIGSGVEQDLAKAFLLYEKAAILGLVDSQLKIAVMLLRGIGTDADPLQARVWMNKAAEKGNADAQVTLAILLSDTDLPTSFYWYKQAEKQDNTYALHNLAVLYYEGNKVAKDLLMALAYADKSISLGNEDSRKVYDAALAELQSRGGIYNSSMGDALREADTEVHAAGYKDAAWLAAQPANRYIVQLVQLSSKRALNSYLKKHRLQGKVNYLYGKTNAGQVYIVLYATDFSGNAAARQALQGKLSPSIIENAWIRSYRSLQKDYTEAQVH